MALWRGAFQNVLVNEPSQAQTLEILRGLRPSMEQHHGIGIADEVLASSRETLGAFCRRPPVTRQSH